MRVTVIPIAIRALVTVIKSLERGLEELKIGRQIETIKTTVVKIGQHTEKSPGDSKTLAVIQTPQQVHLCRGVSPTPNECPVFDSKQSDGEVPVMLEFWGMRSTYSLPSLPSPLWTGVVAPDRVLYIWVKLN